MRVSLAAWPSSARLSTTSTASRFRVTSFRIVRLTGISDARPERVRATVGTSRSVLRSHSMMNERSACGTTLKSSSSTNESRAGLSKGRSMTLPSSVQKRTRRDITSPSSSGPASAGSAGIVKRTFGRVGTSSMRTDELSGAARLASAGARYTADSRPTPTTSRSRNRVGSEIGRLLTEVPFLLSRSTTQHSLSTHRSIAWRWDTDGWSSDRSAIGPRPITIDRSKTYSVPLRNPLLMLVSLGIED